MFRLFDGKRRKGKILLDENELYGAAWTLQKLSITVEKIEKEAEEAREFRNNTIIRLSDKTNPNYRTVQDLMAITGLSHRSIARIIRKGNNR